MLFARNISLTVIFCLFLPCSISKCFAQEARNTAGGEDIVLLKTAKALMDDKKFADALNILRPLTDKGIESAALLESNIYVFKLKDKKNIVRTINILSKIRETVLTEGIFMDIYSGVVFPSYQDDGKEVFWARKRAARGDAAAEVVLGNAYDYGLGVVQDHKMANEFYQQAANQGNGDGEAGLGKNYAAGAGVEKNSTLAFRWLSKAAAQNNPFGQLILGDMYADGEGVARDPIKAKELFTLSAAQGNELAIKHLQEGQFGQRSRSSLTAGLKRRRVNKAALLMCGLYVGHFSNGPNINSQRYQRCLSDVANDRDFHH